MVEPFDVTFRYDGEALTKGKVQLFVSKCKVEGVDFVVPTAYAAFLLHEETKNEAWRLLEEVSRNPLVDGVKTALLKEACKGGFEKPWGMLEKFNREAPCGKPRFYADLNSYNGTFIDWTADGTHVVLTDGESAFRFNLTSSRILKTSRLPLNVYRFPSSTRFTLTANRYKIATENMEEFFLFVKDLERIDGFVSNERRKKCFAEFFEDRKQAYEMLRLMSGDADRRIRREEIFAKLENKKILEFSGGFFVHGGWRNVFYVTKNGEVYILKYSEPVDTREAIQRGVEKGKPPRKIKPVDDEKILREVARIVGSVKPELALVISP